jgi:hypothetical protein
MAERADNAGEPDGAGRGLRTLPPDLLPAALAFLVPAAALCAHASRHLPFVSDDSLISLRYARRLLDGHGLTWTDGASVEGYSNLLWLLGCAATGAFGVDLVIAARALGFAGMLGALLALVVAYRPDATRPAPSTTAHRADATGSVLPAMTGGLLLAASAPIAVWTIGGLEQPLVAALLAWAIADAQPLVDGAPLTTRRAARTGLPLALLCLTRPDSPLFVVAFAFSVWIVRGGGLRALRPAALLCLLPAAAVIAQLVFRLLYYDDWLPNTAYVKAGTSARRAVEGAAYVLGGIGWLWPAVLLAGAGAWAGFVEGHRRGRVVLLVSCIVLWSVYVAAVGGDFLPVYRHLVPVLVCMAFLAAPAVEFALHNPDVRRRAAYVAAALALVALGFQQQVSDPERYERARIETWEWDCRDLANLLREGFGKQRPLIAVTAAGCLPYFSELPALDMLGLNDRHIARHRPRGFVPGVLGHDLGDERYVLRRRPDLIVFNIGEREPSYEFGRRMISDDSFLRDYGLTAFASGNQHAWIWVRRFGRVGLERSSGRIAVPAYLLMGARVVAGLGPGGRMGAVVPANAEVKTFSFDLPVGVWTVTTEPNNATARFKLRKVGGGAPLAEMGTGGRLTVRLEQTERVWLSVRLAEPAFLHKVVFDRAAIANKGANRRDG